MDGIGWTAREVSSLDNEGKRAVAAKPSSRLPLPYTRGPNDLKPPISSHYRGSLLSYQLYNEVKHLSFSNPFL